MELLRGLTNKKLLVLFIILAVVYIVQSVIIPPDQATLSKYHLSNGQASALAASVSLPYLAIWFVALTGYNRLSSYAESISKSKDGVANF